MSVFKPIQTSANQVDWKSDGNIRSHLEPAAKQTNKALKILNYFCEECAYKVLIIGWAVIEIGMHYTFWPIMEGYTSQRKIISIPSKEVNVYYNFKEISFNFSLQDFIKM